MLKEYLLSFGFTEEDYFTFINYNKLREYKKETLYRKGNKRMLIVLWIY